MEADDGSAANTESTQMDEEVFTPFTFLSYQILIERDHYLKDIETKRAKHAQEAHLVDGELKFGARNDEDRLPPENPDLKDGSLFTKTYGRFPPNLLGTPIEELDPGVREKTFVVINSRFRKKYISRYTATNSLFIFPPWNRVRKITLYLATNQFFDLFIFTTIVVNCIFLAAPSLNLAETIEYVFLAIYTFECVVKVVARGLIFNKSTYLRDPWNWLDFMVINTAFLTIVLQSAYQLTVGNLQGLRTFRVLRALKTVSIIPGLKTIVNALLRAFKMLFEVILLTIFCLMVYAMFGLQYYMGVLRQKCVLNITGYDDNSSETYTNYYIQWIRNPDNWYYQGSDYVVCGNSTGAGLCPNGYTCIPNVGDNPRYGYLNFDHIGWALLSCFQLITLDFWEDIYNKILSASGPWHVLYFIITIFFGAFYLINLMLAVVSMSYEEEAVSAVKEKEREKKDSARKKHNAMYEMSYKQMKAKLLASSLPVTDSNDVETLEIININSNSGAITRILSEDKETDNFSPLKFKQVSSMESRPQSFDDSGGVKIVKADNLLNPEIGYASDQLIDRNCDCCERWLCKYPMILKTQNYVYGFASDPLFDLFITACIAMNTLFMSLEHHNQSSTLTTCLAVANYVFTSVFLTEACIKIFGLGKYYFIVGWNIFDLITVIASVLDLALEQVNGLNVLRTFRLLRVFKLAQSWPTMRLLLTIILSTLGALGNLCLILFIVIYIFAIIGLQLFQTAYIAQNFDGGVPRWNFTDFYHSMLMIFRVLCGEWIEPLYDCMKANNEVCMVVFLPALVFGNFVVLNLFLALLLNAFASDSLDKHRETSAERSKLMDGVYRLIKLIFCCFTFSSDSPSNETEDKLSEGGEESAYPSKFETAEEITILQESYSAQSYRNEYKNNSGLLGVKTSKIGSMRSPFGNYNNSSSKLKATESENRDDYEEPVTYNEDSSYNSDSMRPPPDCFPLCISRRITCITLRDDSDTMRAWNSLRAFGSRIVNHKMFELTVMLMILASCLLLALEDIYIYQKPTLESVLHISNVTFAILFTIEMILRWVGLGFTEYFTNLWTLLDFCIVLVSLLTVIGDQVGFGNIAAFKSLRTLRSLRPLRAISRWQGMKIVVNALMNAIPAIMNVFLVCMVFWLIFSIMGVQFFKGEFYRCINTTSLDVFDYTVIPNKTTCLETVDGDWQNPNVNFDNAAIGFLALFQVATFEGWMEVISSAVDTTEVDMQPRFEASPLAYVYFVVFIICGSFFSMNLFIGVIIDNFNVLKKSMKEAILMHF